MMRDFLPREFFERPFPDVARDLVGCVLEWDGCAGLIVELEAYAVEGDAASHTMSRPRAREFVATHPAGTAYVYLNYGIHWLLNVLVKGGGADGILLLRALEPTAGLDLMRRRRGREAAIELCSGPGKLGMALGLGREDHGRALAGPAAIKSPRRRGFRPGAMGAQITVVTDVRIGISQAVDLPWRYLVRDNPHVSVPPQRYRR